MRLAWGFVMAGTLALAAGCASSGGKNGSATAYQPTRSGAGAQARQWMLPVGTQLSIALDDSLDSNDARQGDTFDAHVLTPVQTPDGTTLIDRGARVRGHIVAVNSTGTPSLALSFDSVDTSDGDKVINVTVQDAAPYATATVPSPPNGAQAMLFPAGAQNPNAIGGGPGGGDQQQAQMNQLRLPDGAQFRVALSQPLYFSPR